MLFDGEMSIDDKRYEDIIRIGYENAKKNLEEFEQSYSCRFNELGPNEKKKLAPGELDKWRISFLVVKTLEDKVN